MTFLTYCLLIITATVTIFFRIEGKKSTAIFVGGIIVVWTLVIRMSEPTADMLYYTQVMSGDVNPVLLGHATEPVLWFFHRQLFNATQDVFITWIIGDLILLSFLFLAVKNLRFGLNMDSQPASQTSYYPAIFVVILISWPYFIGLASNYRQFAAEIFFLYAASTCRVAPIKSFIIFGMSCLTHNAIALFLPILIILAGTRYGKMLYCLSILFTPLIFSFVDSGRASIYVGQLLAISYPIFLIGLATFLCFLVISQGIKISKELRFINAFLPYVVLNAWLFLPNNQAERFGQLGLALALPILLVFIANKFRDKRQVVFFTTIFCSVPMFTFYKSMLG